MEGFLSVGGPIPGGGGGGGGGALASRGIQKSIGCEYTGFRV